jgi:hypothetical protein
VFAADALAALQVGDRARDSHGAVFSACAQQATLACASHRLLCSLVQLEVSAQRLRVHVRVHANPLCPQPPGLTLACVDYLLMRSRGVQRRRLGEMVGGCALDVHQQIDAVKQRPAQAAAMARKVGFAAGAALALAGEPARTGIGRRNQHEARWICRAMARSDDRHLAILQRLAQRLKRRSCELRELVK